MDKNKLSSFLKSISIDGLLSGEGFVRYRTLLDLLDRKDNDKEVKVTRKLGCEDTLIRKIFDKQNKQDTYTKFYLCSIS